MDTYDDIHTYTHTHTHSDGFFELPAQPKRVGVIGAGYIAVELAGVLHELGSETTLFCRGETVGVCVFALICMWMNL